MDKSLVLNQLTEVPEDAGERARYYNGFYQLAFITKDRGALKQDDRLDVLAEGVGHWVESVRRDETKAAERSEAKALDKELHAFMKTCKKLHAPRKGRRPTRR